MSKLHALNTTRPEFLFECITDLVIRRPTVGELNRVLPNHQDLMYCAYTVIRDANISHKNIKQVVVDGDGAVIQYKKKSYAQEVKSQFNKEIIRMGEKKYKLNIRIRDCSVYVSIEWTNPPAPIDDDDDM